MSKKDWSLWRGLVIWARARRIREARHRAVLRAYNEYWMKENRAFIRKCEREDWREIRRIGKGPDCDTSSATGHVNGDGGGFFGGSAGGPGA